MLRLLVLLGFAFTCSISSASPVDHLMTIKQRLRLSLWVEGLQEGPQTKLSQQSKRVLPEEIERALRKL
jgi:hypothetical protein